MEVPATGVDMEVDSEAMGEVTILVEEDYLITEDYLMKAFIMEDITDIMEVDLEEDIMEVDLEEDIMEVDLGEEVGIMVIIVDFVRIK